MGGEWTGRRLAFARTSRRRVDPLSRVGLGGEKDRNTFG